VDDEDPTLSYGRHVAATAPRGLRPAPEVGLDARMLAAVRPGVVVRGRDCSDGAEDG
jgi:hypothetical protein